MVQQFQMRSIQFSTSAQDVEADWGDLYGGGRKGSKFEEDEVSHEGEGDSFDREKAAKKASEKLITEQFSLRRNPQEMSHKTIDEILSKHARVIAAASTSTKVKGLTLATREQYLNKIAEVLYDNYVAATKEPVWDRLDMEECGKEMEYKVFSGCTTFMLYRNGLAKQVSIILIFIFKN